MDTFTFIKDFLIILRSEILAYRAMFATVFTLVLVAVVFVSLNWPKFYVSNATIVKDITNVIEPLLRGAAEITDINKGEKVRDIIYSRRMMEKVIDRLELHDMTPEQKELMILKIRDGLNIVAVGRSSGLTNIEYKADSAKDAYKTLAAVVDVFIEDRIEDKQKKSYEAHDFISQQAENYKRRLEAAEAKLKEFKSQSVDVSENTVKTRIAALSSEIETLKMSMGESREKIRSTKTQIESEGENVALRMKLATLGDRRDSLSTRLDQLRLTYQDSYPDIIALKEQLAEVNDELFNLTGDPNVGASMRSDLPLLEELRKQFSSAEVTLKIQERRLAALEGLLEKELALADVVNSNQAKLLDLTRDYDVTKGLYEKMLSRKENAKLTLALNDEGQGESYKLVDPPSFPLSASGIRALYIFFAAPIAAFCIPLGLIIIIVIMDPRMRSATVVNSVLPDDVPLLANIPHRTSQLSKKILRKDIFLLAVLAASLVMGYVYAFLIYKPLL